ncbi:hypothetical protein TWF694_003728 [Orbilia ellipsospora]|uniref:TPR domain protein n=1 Tax=Orbilia ellipsospora TaxID=2528407 RepID=A0AAV9WZ00_9PEZI
MSFVRSIKLGARNPATASIRPFSQCTCTRVQTQASISKIQWPPKPVTSFRPLIIRRTYLRATDPSKKQGYNPHVDIDRFGGNPGSKRKYNFFKLQTYREAYHDSPKMFTMFIVSFFVVISVLGVAFYWTYKVMIVGLHNYPEPVARYMRRAMYYEGKKDLEGCIKSYQSAIVMAQLIGMDPLSDEFTGLRIKYAEIGEDVGAYDKAIEYLERLRLEMLALMDDRKEELGVLGRLKLMKRVIGIAVKIGDMQLLEKDEEQAEKTFEWSVAQTLKVMADQSRLKEEEEAPWTAEQLAAVFENMASLYERSNKFDYASTLYLQAANLFHPPNCHSVVLLNNVGACNMQRRIPSGEPMDRTTQLESAKKWMEKALSIADNMTPPTRNEECDQGCVVALHNIGEIEEQLGRIDEAKQKYIEAESISYAIKYVDGYQNAGFALERIKQKESGIYKDPKVEAEEQAKAEVKKALTGLPPLNFDKPKK